MYPCVKLPLLLLVGITVHPESQSQISIHSAKGCQKKFIRYKHKEMSVTERQTGERD